MRISKKSLLMLALTILCAGAAHADVAPFSITISTSTNMIKSGGDLILDVVIKNISGQEYIIPTSLSKNRAEFINNIYVKHADGTTVPKTQAGQRLAAKAVNGSMGGCKLKPGDNCKEWTYVTRLYDMRKPGTYLIQVDRMPRTLSGAGAVVTSNTITVQVTP